MNTSIELQDGFDYQWEVSMDSRTRCPGYTLIGISTDNRTVTRTPVTLVEYYRLKDLFDNYTKQKFI